MSLTDPITDYLLARFLFVQARFAWVGASLALVAVFNLTVRKHREQLTPTLCESLRWAQLPLLAVAAFNASVLVAFFLSDTPEQAADIVWGDLEWLAALMVIVVYTSYRATAPWVGHSFVRLWGCFFLGVIITTQVLGAALWWWRAS